MARKLSFRKLQLITYSVIALGLLCVLLPYGIVWLQTNKLSTTEMSDLPAADVALVLGTSPKVGQRANRYFTYRIDAAEALYKSGKVKCLLLSGANPSLYYNEPLEMLEALVERGVPKEKIVLDYAGLRTLDSVVRAKEIFEAKDVIIVSQEFHTHRALFIAKHIDLTATAYEALDVEEDKARITFREILARVRVMLDLYITNTGPKFLGQKQTLPLSL